MIIRAALILILGLAWSSPGLSLTLIGSPPELPSAEPPSGLVLTPGTYRMRWITPVRPSTDLLLSSVIGSCGCWEGAEDKVARSPEFTSKSPLYGDVVFYRAFTAESRCPMIPFALDESKGTGTGYDTMYLDANRNADLTDDPVLVGRAEGGDNATALHLPAAIRMPMSELLGVDNPHLAVVDISVIFKPGEDVYGWVALRSCWLGEIASNKGKIPFRLVDRTGSGDFGDGPGQFDDGIGDVLALDWSGRADFSSPARLRMHGLRQRAIGLNGKLYTVGCTPSGDCVEIRPFEGQTAKIAAEASRIGSADIKISLFRLTGQMGDYSIHANDRPIDVPPGEYSLSPVRVTARSLKGGECGFRCSLASPIRVSPGKTHVMRVGGPLILRIAPGTPDLTLKRGEMTSIPLALMLPSGATATGIYGTSSRPPRFALRSALGKAVQDGGLGFG